MGWTDLAWLLVLTSNVESKCNLLILGSEYMIIMVLSDEHIIRCSECGRNLIVKDTVNNGVAFLSHLELDHGITYVAQRMTMTKTKSRTESRQQLQ
jgi:hypothetical protein